MMKTMVKRCKEMQKDARSLCDISSMETMETPMENDEFEKMQADVRSRADERLVWKKNSARGVGSKQERRQANKSPRFRLE
jgi:hypothetical protein